MRQTRKRLKAKNRKKISHTTKGGGLGWFRNPVTRTKEMGKKLAVSTTSKSFMNYLINPNYNNREGFEQSQQTLATLFNNIEKWWNALPDYPIQANPEISLSSYARGKGITNPFPESTAEFYEQEKRRQSKRKLVLYLLYIFKNSLNDSYGQTAMHDLEQGFAQGDITSEPSPDTVLARILIKNIDMFAKNLVDAVGPTNMVSQAMQFDLRSVYPICDANWKEQDTLLMPSEGIEGSEGVLGRIP